MFSTVAEWEAYADSTRRATLDRVVFRGEAVNLSQVDLAVEALVRYKSSHEQQSFQQHVDSSRSIRNRSNGRHSEPHSRKSLSAGAAAERMV